MLSTSSSVCRSSCDQPLAWVVSRQLQDFLELHQQLLEVTFFLLWFLIYYLTQYLTWCGFTSVESMYLSTHPVQTSSNHQPVDLAECVFIKNPSGQSSIALSRVCLFVLCLSITHCLYCVMLMLHGGSVTLVFLCHRSWWYSNGITAVCVHHYWDLLYRLLLCLSFCLWTLFITRLWVMIWKWAMVLDTVCYISGIFLR